MTSRHGLNRRALLASTGALAAGLAAGTAVPAAAEDDHSPAAPAVLVRPGDRRYDSLLRGNNFRFVGSPDEIRVAADTAQVVAAVADAVRCRRQVSVRSGGHCFEGFWADPAVRVLLDLSPMNAVEYDPAKRAFLVRPGATLGQVYRRLYTDWGVTIPAGGCSEVGAGGHLCGGGYGPLSRRYGSVVDHLYAVEVVVVVDRHGAVRAVTATREPDDPNRDLWWAHTGGGGGNFGVVTGYWLRSPDATGDDPAGLLPPAPAHMLAGEATWAWDSSMTEGAFTTLLRNFGRWHERNSAPGAPGTGLYAVFTPAHRTAGSFTMTVQADAELPGVASLMQDLVDAVTAGSGTSPAVGTVTMPWMYPATWPGIGTPGNLLTRRYKEKAGYLRQGYPDDQLTTIHRWMTGENGNAACGMLLVGYGGQVNTVAPAATAVAQRDSVMKAVFHSIWADESEDAANLAWVRGCYRDVYGRTGGVPVPGAVSDGSYINYVDVDLADPAWNTSGVGWPTLYYKGNYPRLQRIKAAWDPLNVFHHPMSVQASG
ncbi:FAD-binding protein [Kitasatospora viridis]|uniref:Aclacinomycin oxidase n=1 Tax=Kitasatospora viridis TaxID=281105 RepID=A0A561TT83_9ACTN|nr:FAD-binding protein [Kitasatospora viridis]TWF90332.1 aclacinomycin oxidase [Kitasatospora viridis]